jgi:hypothetical protein
MVQTSLSPICGAPDRLSPRPTGADGLAEDAVLVESHGHRIIARAADLRGVTV